MRNKFLVTGIDDAIVASVKERRVSLLVLKCTYLTYFYDAWYLRIVIIEFALKFCKLISLYCYLTGLVMKKDGTKIKGKN